MDLALSVRTANTAPAHHSVADPNTFQIFKFLFRFVLASQKEGVSVT
jgi:hypothetical protein